MFMLLCLGTIYAFYAYDGILFSNLRFENDVKMYGTQTEMAAYMGCKQLENDVKMYGILPICRDLLQKAQLENNVKYWAFLNY